ncbi:SidA/IucD/PvdA family monooxygenase [Myceligenerans crystallogenes]|uniref:L-lysine N6-monooxygenase MbtG n=1 Tax=Myceligenerans crystallogenes TaxID=316335 RepID=A0ABN2N7I3_9MICO
MPHDPTDPVVAPLVGVGFGPAGIALSVCLSDEERQGLDVSFAPARDAVFFERALDPVWQPGMLLPGTDIQHHFLRDFATPRDPDSRFTFVKFLQEEDRFYPFTLRGGYVTREEWSKYCVWVAERTESRVHYGHEVGAIRPVTDDTGTLVAVDVDGRDTATGATRTVRTRRVVLATGHEPFVPEVFQDLGPRVFHSTQFSRRWPELGDQARRIVVVGGGQNAGEVLLHLYHSTSAELVSVVRNSGMRLYDLGHFANQAYWPAETDYFHALGHDERQAIFAEQHRTNYAAVDPDVTTGLYNAWYDEHVRGTSRLTMLKRTEVTRAWTEGDEVHLELRDRYTGTVDKISVDLVILGTGFREPAVPAALEPLAGHLTVESDGALAVDRDFTTPLRDAADVRVYLNGMSERRHGIASATSFSLMAHRAGEIVGSLRAAAGS